MPDKPMEAKGLGCGFFLTSLLFYWGMVEYLGISGDIAIYISIGLTTIPIIIYLINQHKAQQVLNHEYVATKQVKSSSEKLCPFCSETIQSSVLKCKHCLSMLNETTTQLPDPIKSPDKENPQPITQQSPENNKPSPPPPASTKSELKQDLGSGEIIFFLILAVGGIVVFVILTN